MNREHLAVQVCNALAPNLTPEEHKRAVNALLALVGEPPATEPLWRPMGDATAPTVDPTSRGAECANPDCRLTPLGFVHWLVECGAAQPPQVARTAVPTETPSTPTAQCVCSLGSKACPCPVHDYKPVETPSAMRPGGDVWQGSTDGKRWLDTDRKTAMTFINYRRKPVEPQSSTETAPDTCPTCKGEINQEAIDHGCRVVTVAGKRGVRCGKTGAFVEGSTETPTTTCAGWCGTDCKNAMHVDVKLFCNGGDDTHRDYCTAECRTARKPLNPAPLQPTATTGAAPLVDPASPAWATDYAGLPDGTAPVPTETVATQPPPCACDQHEGLSCHRAADYLVTRAGRRIAVCDRCILSGDGAEDLDLNPDWSKHRPVEPSATTGAAAPPDDSCSVWGCTSKRATGSVFCAACKPSTGSTTFTGHDGTPIKIPTATSEADPDKGRTP